MYAFLSFLKKKESSVAVIDAFWGLYSFVDIILVDGQNIKVYRTRPGERFSSFAVRKDVMVNLEYFTKHSVYLQIEVTEEEFQKLHRTCTAFSSVETPFNRKDYLLHYIPIRIPDEIPLFQTTTLSDSQAVTLFLRECLGPAHQMKPALLGTNSRHVVPENLYDLLAPLSKPLDWLRLCPMLPWSA